MGFEGFIANKHMTHRRKAGFVSLISMISIFGVAVGVMVLIWVLAVMSGFDRELKAKIVGIQPHLRIEKFGGLDYPEQEIQKIAQHPGLKTVAGFVDGQAILRSEENVSGVLVKGLDAGREDLSIYANHLLSGTLDFQDVTTEQTHRRFFFFKKTVRKKWGSIFIGDILAERLHVRVGDTVTLIAPAQKDRKSTRLNSSH